MRTACIPRPAGRSPGSHQQEPMRGDVDTQCRVQLLGGLRVRQGGREITHFRTHKTAALLAYLAYYLPRSHPREVLIGLLWPESDLDAGRHSLSVAVSALRHQLEPP